MAADRNKHTRLVDMGTADQNCTATHNYEQSKQQTSTAKKHTFEIPKLGHRKFAIS